MRKIIFMMSVSLDGFFEGPDRELDWHLVDEEVHTHFNTELAVAGAFLDGRVTYELMADYWPSADQDPQAPAPIREFANIWREMPKIVYSRTLREAGWNTTIVREIDAEQVARLKAEPGGDLMVGGAVVGAEFRRLGLIDEYWIYLHPVLLGSGRPAFSNGQPFVGLTLAETRTFGNGVVRLRYLASA